MSQQGKRIGVIGLGAMGRGMAGSLRRAGYARVAISSTTVVMVPHNLRSNTWQVDQRR